jgi:large subunit ribosomal protein L29
MKASDVREMDLAELNKKEADIREELFRTHMLKGSGQSTKTDVYKKLRKDIARIKTIITEKEGSQKSQRRHKG